MNCYVLIHANRGSPPLPVSRRSICNPCFAILYFFNVLPEQNNFNTSIAFTLRDLTFHFTGNLRVTKFCIFSDLTRSATFKPLFSEILNSLYSILENTFNGPKYFNASATWVKWLDFIKAVWNLRYQFDCLRNTI